jgi:hypothetical protein
MPRGIDDFVACKALLFDSNEVFQKGMKRLKAQPTEMPVIVEESLSVGKI